MEKTFTKKTTSEKAKPKVIAKPKATTVKPEVTAKPKAKTVKPKATTKSKSTTNEKHFIGEGKKTPKKLFKKDIEKDGSRMAKEAGWRKSESGRWYKESRPDHSDYYPKGKGKETLKKLLDENNVL